MKRVNVAVCRRYLSARLVQQELKKAGVDSVIVTKYGVQVDPVLREKALGVVKSLVEKHKA